MSEDSAEGKNVSDGGLSPYQQERARAIIDGFGGVRKTRVPENASREIQRTGLHVINKVKKPNP